MDGNNLVTFELDHTVEVKPLDEFTEFRFELVLGVGYKKAPANGVTGAFSFLRLLSCLARQ